MLIALFDIMPKTVLQLKTELIYYKCSYYKTLVIINNYTQQ